MKAIFPIVMLVISPLCSAVGIVLTKGLVTFINPLEMLVIQLAASVTFLWAAAAAAKKISRPPKGEIYPLIALGIIIGIASICTIFALSYTSASQASVIFASEPILIALLAWPILGEQPTWRVIALGLLALVGVCVVAYVRADAGSMVLAGNLLAFTSTTLAALYTVWMRKVVGAGQPLMSLAIVQTAALALSGLVLPFGTHFPIAQLHATGWIAAGLSGVLLYGLAYWLYLIGLQRVRAEVAAVYLNLVPIFAVSLAFFVLGETLAARQWIGAGATLIAVIGISVLALFGRQTERALS